MDPTHVGFVPAVAGLPEINAREACASLAYSVRTSLSFTTLRVSLSAQATVRLEYGTLGTLDLHDQADHWTIPSPVTLVSHYH